MSSRFYIPWVLMFIAASLDYIGIWNASMLQAAEIDEAMAAAGDKRQGDFVDLPTNRLKMGTDIID